MGAGVLSPLGPLVYIDPPFDTGANFSFTTEVPESRDSIEPLTQA
jgi:hypothetical protein